VSLEERALRTIAELLEEHSLAGYLVGGYVRDRLLGRASVDIDLVVRHQAIELAKETADRLGGRFSTTVYQGFKWRGWS